MSENPGELAPGGQSDPSQPPAPESSGATATFLAELRGGAADGSGGALDKKSKFSGPTMMVLGVVAVGIVLLFGMRKFATGGAGDFNPVKIEYTPDALAEARAKSQRAVLDALERSGTPVQVPTDQIKKNPFELASKPKTTVEPVPTGLTPEQIAAANAKRMAEALNGVKLNGIMGGKTPLARINNETVRVGDKVGDTAFTVKSISGRSVTLEFDGKEYLLEMESSKAPGTGPRRGK